MKVLPTALPGVLLIEPTVWADSRGTFRETWQLERYATSGLPTHWAQDNVSVSTRHVLRGLHFQSIKPQGKLVTVLAGAILDVAVDVRHGSAHFGQSAVAELSERNARQLYVPPGFAHGFMVLSAEAVVHYKCTQLYHPASERTLIWNDPALSIAWPDAVPILSEKDAAGTRLADFRADELPEFAGPE